MSACTRKLQTILPVVGLLVLVGCGGEESTPESEVRAWVATMQAAAEEKDRGAVLDGISTAYADARGHSRDDVNDLLRIYFLRQNKIAFLTSIDEVRIIGGTAAEVELTVGMAGTNDRALGISADAYRFELELENDGDDWLLISARWGALGDPLR